MSENTSTTLSERRWTPEFFLVIVMLVVLTTLVCVILRSDIPQMGNVPPQQGLEYRQNILSIIMAAFGAWIGAGAAYYFGRENLREVASSLLAMRGPTPQERLRQTSVGAMPLRPIDWNVKRDTAVKDVVDMMKVQPERWFLVVVKADGALDTVLHEEAVWRFINDYVSGTSVTPAMAYQDVMKKTMDDVIKHVEATEGLKRLKNIHIVVSTTTTAGDANRDMVKGGIYLAIVADSANKPTHHITTGDIRTMILADS